MRFTSVVIGGNAAVRAVGQIVVDVERGSERGVKRTVQGGAGLVKGRASGRPGPRVITGDYRRSISGDVIEISSGHVIGQIGTNAAQGRRLEFGFFGPDSLGRRYSQMPFPHFQPAVPDIAELALAEVPEAISQELAA